MSAIGATSPTTTTPASQLSKDQLSMQQFMQLMVSQLQNQDPLNPMSSSDFFAQLAQLGQVQGMDQLNQSSQLQEAQGLLGKTVTAASNVNGLNSTVTGTVSQVSLQSGSYMLGVTDATGNTTTVNLTNVENVKA
ncbi:MAG: flagellar hook assembly protein FlgD [Fimbriimonadaceae bacterium]